MTRVLSGVAMAVAALAAIVFLPPIALRVLACLVAALAAREYLKLVGAGEGHLAGVVIVCWIVSTGSITALAIAPLVTLALALFGALLWNGSAPRAILGAFSTLYIGVPLGMLAAVHGRTGWRGTLLLIATVIVSDSLQFYTGRMFGKRPLAPAISPKKTVEGAVGGSVAGTLFMMLAGPLVFPGNAPLGLAFLGVVMVILGIAGDLFESRLKREAHVKDSSALIPGHGGVLDRIDALLLATPAFAVYLSIIQ
jgi:phosphatidate cytidylyltransferase